MLVATGRRPNVDDLGLETRRPEPDGPLTVDDTGLVRGVDGGWLYAAGDVTGRAPLTHQGKYDARIVGAAIGARAAGGPVDTAPWGEHVATADHAAVPQVVFTDPEVASVGLTAAQARDAGCTSGWSTCRSPVAGSTILADDYDGAVRMVVDEDRGVLVGLTFVGQDTAELLHAATIAVVGEVPLAPAVARGARLPDDERGVAAPAGGLPEQLTATARPGTARPRAPASRPSA